MLWTLVMILTTPNGERHEFLVDTSASRAECEAQKTEAKPIELYRGHRVEFLCDPVPVRAR